MDSQWKYVSIDGNPTEPGDYLVALIYDEWHGGEPTGRQLATVCTRYFCDAKREGRENWVMAGEPASGLVWMQECGSWANEHVLAWMPWDCVRNVQLPDGVEWGDE